MDGANIKIKRPVPGKVLSSSGADILAEHIARENAETKVAEQKAAADALARAEKAPP